MKKLFLGALVFAATLSVFSCKKSSSNPDSSIDVAYYCNPPLDNVLNITQNGSFVMGYPPGGTGDIGAISASSTNPDIKLSFAGNGSAADTLFAEFKEAIQPNKRYSAICGGPRSNPCKLFFEDELPSPGSGMAAVRFMNMSSDSFGYNCFSNGLQVDSGLVYQSISPFYLVAGNTSANFTVTYTRPPFVSITVSDTVAIAAGGVYSIVLRGNYADSGASGLSLVRVYHNPPTPL